MHRLGVILLGLVFACGGGEGNGSGVDPDKPVLELTTDEVTDLCTYLTSLAPQPSRELVCDDGTVLTVGLNPEDVDDAIAGCTFSFQTTDPACAATVNDFETCYEAGTALSDAEICDPTVFPPSCDLVLPCMPMPG